MGPVNEILRFVLGGALVISLAGIVAYGLALAVVALGTLWRSRRPDPLAQELDRLLAGLGSASGDVANRQPPKDH